MRCMGCMENIPDGTTICPKCGYNHNAPYDQLKLAPGTWLENRYLIGKCLGAGGFGITYIGWDSSAQRKVAIKEYFPSSLNLCTRVSGQTVVTARTESDKQLYAEGLKRFIDEASLLMKLDHAKGVVRVFDVFASSATAYMVMEYLEGITLKENINNHGRLDENSMLEAITPVMDALNFVHLAGYAHRDISPDNIMCLADGTYKLIDFGAARYVMNEKTRSSTRISKEGFSPIEQVTLSGEQGPWTDIYALGATMYNALTGNVPLDAAIRSRKDTLVPPSELGATVSQNTENGIMSALNLKKEDRPQTIDEFKEILRGERDRKVATISKNKWIPLIIAGGTAIVAAIAAVIFTFALPKSNKIDVPNVVHMQVAAAETKLNEKSLGMEINGGDYASQAEIDAGFRKEGLISEQNPVANTKVDKNSIVGVKYCWGVEQIIAEDVTGMTTDAAMTRLSQLGFGSKFNFEIKEQFSDIDMVGTIISQSIADGDRTDFDGKMTITVSKGPENPKFTHTSIEIDDYVGKDYKETKDKLARSIGVYLVRAGAIYSDEYPKGQIISQDPPAGSKCEVGQAVYVMTSLGSEQVHVPNVLYKEKEEAKEILLSTGLRYKIKYVIDSSVALDHVVSQSPLPHWSVPFLEEIVIHVSAEQEGEEIFTPSDIAVKPESLTIKVGKSAPLTCTYERNGKVKFASSNSNIAEVSEDGTIKGVSFGAATIIAYSEGNVALCKVLVEDDNLVTITEELGLTVGDSIDLAKKFSSVTTNKTTWTSSNAAAVTVNSNGVATAEDAGYSQVYGTDGNRIVSIGIVVSPGYDTLPKAKMKDSESAKKLLDDCKISYTVEEMFSDATPKGSVDKVEHSGYEDTLNYYIPEDTPVKLFVSRGPNKVESLRVKSNPNKTSYNLGDTPDYTGLVLEATYTDGSIKTISSGFTTSYPKLSQNPQDCAVSFGNQTVYVRFIVNPIEPTGISISPSGDQTLNVGKSIRVSVTVNPSNATDRSYTLKSSDSSIVSVSGDTIIGVKVGKTYVTAETSNGKTTKMLVTVVDKSSLTIVSQPNTTTYYCGDTINKQGLVLGYTDAAGNYSKIDSGYEISPKVAPKTEGSCTVTVSYKGQTATFTVTVKKPFVKLTKYNDPITGKLIAITCSYEPKSATPQFTSTDFKVAYLTMTDGQLKLNYGGSEGTCYLSAYIMYNGNTYYSESIPVKVTIEKNETFKIEAKPHDMWNYDIWVNSSFKIPEGTNGVVWSFSVECDYGIVGGTGCVLYWPSDDVDAITVTATYSYNGVTYTDSLTLKRPF